MIDFENPEVVNIPSTKIAGVLIERTESTEYYLFPLNSSDMNRVIEFVKTIGDRDPLKVELPDWVGLTWVYPSDLVAPQVEQEQHNG